METHQQAREQEVADALTGGSRGDADYAAAIAGGGGDADDAAAAPVVAGGGDGVGGGGDAGETEGGTGGRDGTGRVAGTTGDDDDDQGEDEDGAALVPDPVDFVQVRAFKAFLRFIGFTPAAVTQILARGLSSMDSLQGQEKNQVENMCKNIERGTTGTPGIPLNSDSIKWLKLGTYAILRRQYCGWHTTAMDLTKTAMKKWGKFKQSEEDYKEPTDSPSNDNNKLFLRPSRSWTIILVICAVMSPKFP
jgi:hypothetical protein